MDEEFEFDEEVLEHLDNLTRITIEILNIYKRLLNLEINSRDSLYYHELKDLLIQSLAALKQEESDEYNYFSENYGRAVYALDVLEDNYEASSNNMDHNALLCYTRMHGKLCQIETIQGINEEYETNKREVTSTEQYKILRQYGYSEEDAVFLFLDYTDILSNSISLRYASLLEDEIETEPNKEDYIRMRYEESFASSNDLEDTLLTLKFGRIPRKLSDELKTPYGFLEEAKKAFIKYEIDSSLLDIINKINNSKNGYEYAQCKALFKAYLLYVPDDEIKRIIGSISALIQEENISEELTQIAFSHKELKKSQNQDNNITYS